MINLSQLAVGEEAKISSIDGGKNSLRQKLLAFGALPGALIKIVRIAAMGDPLHVKLLSNINFAICKNEAKSIIVEKI